jgi:5-methylcytosine-specific restriction enzyme A
MCGGTKKLQVHHIYPVHISPRLELEPSNLITLCRAKKYGLDCHLFIGHRGDFRKHVQYPDELI